MPNVSLTGTLALQFNTSNTEATDTLQVGGSTVSYDIPGGPFVEVAGTGVTLTAGGQTLSGNVTITATSGPSGQATSR